METEKTTNRATSDLHVLVLLQNRYILKLKVISLQYLGSFRSQKLLATKKSFHIPGVFSFIWHTCLSKTYSDRLLLVNHYTNKSVHSLQKQNTLEEKPNNIFGCVFS